MSSIIYIYFLAFFAMPKYIAVSFWIQYLNIISLTHLSSSCDIRILKFKIEEIWKKY